MTYANAVLPHALFDAAERWPDETFLSIAESTLAYLWTELHQSSAPQPLSERTKTAVARG